MSKVFGVQVFMITGLQDDAEVALGLNNHMCIDCIDILYTRTFMHIWHVFLELDFHNGNPPKFMHSGCFSRRKARIRRSSRKERTTSKDCSSCHIMLWGSK